MDDKDFQFSLYPNDLLYVEHKKGIVLQRNSSEISLPPSIEVTEGLFYFRGMGIATAAVALINHDISAGSKGPTGAGRKGPISVA